MTVTNKDRNIGFSIILGLVLFCILYVRIIPSGYTGIGYPKQFVHIYLFESDYIQNMSYLFSDTPVYFTIINSVVFFLCIICFQYIMYIISKNWFDFIKVSSFPFLVSIPYYYALLMYFL